MPESRLARTRAAYVQRVPFPAYPCGCLFVYDACDYGVMMLPACPVHLQTPDRLCDTDRIDMR